MNSGLRRSFRPEAFVGRQTVLLKKISAANPVPGRITLLDQYRGLALLAMLCYHTLYDLAILFGCRMPWFYTDGMRAFQVSIGVSFVFISGVSAQFSRSPARHGLQIFAVAMGMTLATALVMPSQLIVFGVLHLLGVCSLLFALIRRFWQRIPWSVGFFLGLGLFILTYYVPDGFLLARLLPLPEGLYQTSWLFWLGLPSSSFSSADYYPLIPWLFLFLCGAAAGSWLNKRRTSTQNPLPGIWTNSCLRPLAWIGRHTLIVYVLHQPIIYGVLMLLVPIFTRG